MSETEVPDVSNILNNFYFKLLYTVAVGSSYITKQKEKIIDFL